MRLPHVHKHGHVQPETRRCGLGGGRREQRGPSSRLATWESPSPPTSGRGPRTDPRPTPHAEPQYACALKGGCRSCGDSAASIRRAELGTSHTSVPSPLIPVEKWVSFGFCWYARNQETRTYKESCGTTWEATKPGAGVMSPAVEEGMRVPSASSSRSPLAGLCHSHPRQEGKGAGAAA